MRRANCMALLAAGAVAIFFQYRFALSAWFLREDSRYFSNGLFSFWDLFLAFTSPQNDMGHFRPITKLLWGAPQWLGISSPFVYHSISLAMLFASATALMRLSFLLFENLELSLLTGILWALMPVNAKAVYWYSACQDLACSLFVFCMLVFRIEQWRNPAKERFFRRLFLLSLLGALCSREIGLAASPLVLLIDAAFHRLRRTWEAAVPAALIACWIFVINPPFAKAHIEFDPRILFSASPLKNLWNYSLSTFWAPADGAMGDTPLSLRLASGTFLAILALGPAIGRAFALPFGLAVAGIGPFLLINAYSIEYAFTFGAATALAVGGLVAKATRSLHPALTSLLGVGLIFTYLTFLSDSRSFYRDAYVGHSLLLRTFFADLKRDTRSIAPYRLIEIVNFGPYRDSPARDTHHFIAKGLDELIPDRVILYSKDFLGIPEGTFLHDPARPFWGATFPRLSPPLAIRYTGKGFTLD